MCSCRACIARASPCAAAGFALPASPSLRLAFAPAVDALAVTGGALEGTLSLSVTKRTLRHALSLSHCKVLRNYKRRAAGLGVVADALGERQQLLDAAPVLQLLAPQALVIMQGGLQAVALLEDVGLRLAECLRVRSAVLTRDTVLQPPAHMLTQVPCPIWWPASCCTCSVCLHIPAPAKPDGACPLVPP